ncbi:MAG: PTS sugar transporter subunit IIA [Desulfurococcus sp.]|nr:PTS sugar transporter subunit IIA [Desulfurococcus sp.]
MDWLTLEDILVDVEVGGWEEAVRVAGGILYKRGRIEEKYIDAMINTVRELGPYAVIAPGVALPHARPEDGALKPGFSIVVLRKPVNFGSPNDPVKVVIAFASPDKKSHLQALQVIAELLSNEEARSALMSARDPRDILAVVECFTPRDVSG